MPTNSKAGSNSKAMLWVGWGMSGLAVLFMVFDGLSKLVLERHVVEATTKIGYPVDVIQPLGIILLISTILYAIPRTAIFGAILLTGYLGGTVASKVRIEDPLFSSILFGVYFGVLAGADFICGMTVSALSSHCADRPSNRAYSPVPSSPNPQSEIRNSVSRLLPLFHHFP
jgi:hypothetical protein